MDKETNIEEATALWCQSLEDLAKQMSVTAEETRAGESNIDLRYDDSLLCAFVNALCGCDFLSREKRIHDSRFLSFLPRSEVVVDTRELLERIHALESASKRIQTTSHALTEKRMVLEASITAINKENEGYIDALRKQQHENH